MSRHCPMTIRHTLITAALFVVLPACGIAWAASIVGPCLELLYLAAVTLVPAGLTILAPWVRAWLEMREESRRVG